LSEYERVREIYLLTCKKCNRLIACCDGLQGKGGGNFIGLFGKVEKGRGNPDSKIYFYHLETCYGKDEGDVGEMNNTFRYPILCNYNIVRDKVS